MNTDAYTQGYEAAHAGQPQRANPYLKGSTPALWWLRGWQEARAESASLGLLPGELGRVA